MADPTKILFGAYRREILGLLLLRLGESFHVRHIARLTGVPVGSLNRELALLLDAGLLTRRHIGNQVHYQANQDNPIFNEMAGIFRKTTGVTDVLGRALEPLGDQVHLAFVFGSMAQGRAGSSSDVDLIIIGPADFTFIAKALIPVHERLGREVNPVVMTADDFFSLLAKSDSFITRLMREPKLFVKGSQDDLIETAADNARTDTCDYDGRR